MISRVAPQYPELARRMHVEGTVIMRIVVKPDGTVSDAHTESGHPLLRQAAEEAVSQWRFGSAPDATSMNIQVVFAR